MTDKEIMQVLRCCRLGNPCTSCPAAGRGKEVCFDEVHAAAVAAIERLTAENAALRKEIEWKDMVIALAQRKQAEAEAERDALREKVPQWISVEEKLPTDHLKRYLIAFKDAGGSIVDAARYIPGLGWECYNWDVPQKLITHWMPLPSAPEEGEKA